MWLGFSVTVPVAAQAPEDEVAITITTALGEIGALVYPSRAPITAANFLHYVDGGVFDGAAFYRSVRPDNQPDDSVRIDVIQAAPAPSARDRLGPPIPLEATSVTGLSHVEGALSMARGGPDTGRASFFVSIGDQPSLDEGGARNPDGQGFAVFGRVTSGMDVVRRIHGGETEGQRLVEPVVVSSIRRQGGRPPRTALDEARRRLDAWVEGSAIPGAVFAAAFADGSSARFSSGWADTVARRPIEASDRMLAGSVGKTYFAAAALQLVAEGRLDLDAPVADYLADETWLARVPNGREVTVRQLMAHTSGIARYELDPAFLEELRARPLRTFTPEERLSYLLDRQPAFEPGGGWEYSDTNYILVAMIVERVAGGSAHEEIRRRLLEPLQLHGTVPSDGPRVEGLINGYAGPRHPFGSFDATVDEGRLSFNPQFEWGGGGYAATALDLALWVRHVHEGRAFDPRLLGEVRAGVPAPLGPEARYGLGVIMMELGAGAAWGHSGFMPGYRTEAYYFPRHGLGVALQVNSSDPGAFTETPLGILDELVSILTSR